MNMSNKYALFLFSDYYPQGGYNDLAIVGTQEEVFAHLKQDQVKNADNHHLFNCSSGKFIATNFVDCLLALKADDWRRVETGPE
jgi:hypothetical protein